MSPSRHSAFSLQTAPLLGSRVYNPGAPVFQESISDKRRNLGLRASIGDRSMEAVRRQTAHLQPPGFSALMGWGGGGGMAYQTQTSHARNFSALVFGPAWSAVLQVNWCLKLLLKDDHTGIYNVSIWQHVIVSAVVRSTSCNGVITGNSMIM